MLKMKKLLSIIVLVIMLIACKQNPKTSAVEGKKNKETIIKKQTEEVVEEKEQTIEEFLQQLQLAIKNNDMVIIKKSVSFPFEFKIGGEPFIYNNMSELTKDCPDFYEIDKAKFEKLEGNLYNILYEEPGVSEDPPEGGRFFIYYYAVKKGGSFKLVSMEKPH